MSKHVRSMLPVLVVMLLLSTVIGPTAFADSKNSQEGGDNKVIVTNVPMGDAVQIIPFGTAIGGKGSVPDSNGMATAYAPLGKVSQVLLWNEQRGYILLATVNPATTWPDTTVSAAGH